MAPIHPGAARHLTRRTLLGWLASLAPLGAASQPQASSPSDPPGLVWGLTATRGPEQLITSWDPFVQRIAAKIGRPIKLWAAPSAAALIDAFREHRVDLAWSGNATALEIVESGVGEVFAQMVTADGRTGYQSVLVTQKDSRLQRLEDVHREAARLRFGDGEPKSTSGHLVPLYYAFVKRGINDPKTLFASIRHETHQTNLRLAANREVDVATANNVELDLLRAEHPALASELKVIWESPPIPHSPLLWSLRLSAALRRRIQSAVTSFGGNAAEKQVLQQVNNLVGFRPSKNSQLVTVADIEMFAAWQKINNDSQSSVGDKAERIQSISRRASRLELMLKLPPSLQ